MTDVDLQNEKDFMKCWRKKTVSVSAKVILALACIIDAVAAVGISIYGSAAIWGVIKNPTGVAAIFIAESVGYAIGILLGIPWYVYVVVVGISVIPAYSWVWCVAREFTDEEWDFDCIRDITWYEHILHMLLVLPYSIENKDFKTSKVARILLFTSAYLHYRKRTRSNK